MGIYFLQCGIRNFLKCNKTFNMEYYFYSVNKIKFKFEDVKSVIKFDKIKKYFLTVYNEFLQGVLGWP